MAKKGTIKALSVEHEELIAELYNGRRSKSSGGAVTDDGDVRTDDVLFECKGKFGERGGEKPVRSGLLRQFEKIADEAYANNLEPALALRFYVPESPLADPDGYVDLMVRLLEEDLIRLRALAHLRELRACGGERWH